MDAGGAGHLGDAGNGHFDVGGCDEHEVGQFVNNNDDVAQVVGDDDFLVARHHNLLVQFHSEAVGADLDLFAFGSERQFEVCGWGGFILGPFIEGADVADADFGEDLVALLHFIDDPAEREDDLFGVGDDRDDQMGEGVVLLEFDDFGVNHDKAQFVRGEAIEEGRDDGVDANRFAGAGAAGDEQVGHLREVGDDGGAIDVLAESDGDAGLGVAPFVGLEKVADNDLGLDSIGDLNADGAFARDGHEDVDALGFEGCGNVVAQGGDFFQLHSRGGMQFVAGDGGAFGDVARGDFDVELGQGLLHEAGVGHQFLLGLGRLERGVGALEEVQRRQLVVADFGGGGDGDLLWLSRREFGPGGGRLDGRRTGVFLSRGRRYRCRGFGVGLSFGVIRDCGLRIADCGFSRIGVFAQDVGRGGGGDFMGRNNRSFIGGRGFFG